MQVSDVLKKARKYPYWAVCLCLVFLVSFYWLLMASDRYVSETNIVLDSPEISPTSFSVTSLLSGSGGSGDLLLLRDHLLSVDMLKKLDKKLDLREHYSKSNIDVFSRLSPEAPMEDFHKYYRSRVHVLMDDYAQVLRVKVQAYTPEMSFKINQMLLSEGERHMNLMGQRLAAEQVKFIEAQVEILAQRLSDSRAALLEYQNRYGLISPTATIESLSKVVAELEAQLATQKAQRSVLLNFQSESSPDVVRLTSEIQAIEQQIQQEQSRMAAVDGEALNKITSEYQTLELQAQFALDLYSNALAALENTRVEAARKLKQISILQAPTYPEYASEPRRVYNAFTFLLLSVITTLIIQMLDMVVREHRD